MKKIPNTHLLHPYACVRKHICIDLSLLPVTVIKHRDEKQCGEDRTYIDYITWVTVHWGKQRYRARSWRLELMQNHGVIMQFTGLLSMAWSACFLIQQMTTLPRGGPSGLGPSTLIINQEMCQSPVYRPMWWMDSLNYLSSQMALHTHTLSCQPPTS